MTGGAASWSLRVAWKESMPEQVGKGHKIGKGQSKMRSNSMINKRVHTLELVVRIKKAL